MGLFDIFEELFDDLSEIATDAICDALDEVQEKVEAFPDKVDVILGDPEVDGGKKGYTRVAREYEETFQEITREYQRAIDFLENQKNTCDSQVDALVEKLSELEKEKETLAQQVEQQARAVADKHGVSYSGVQDALGVSAVARPEQNPMITGPSLFDLIYMDKKERMDQAEQRRYQEIKADYIKKIDQLKQKMNDLKARGDADLRNMTAMISEILEEIAETKMQIADLNLLL